MVPGNFADQRGFRGIAWMVGGDRHHIHLQLADPHAIEQVFEAMVEFGDHQQHLARRIGIADLPMHGQPIRQRRELCSQGISIRRTRQSFKYHPHEELRIFTVVKLLRFKNVAAMVGKEAGDSRHQTRGIRAG
jgi:hypothetical protein